MFCRRFYAFLWSVFCLTDRFSIFFSSLFHWISLCYFSFLLLFDEFQLSVGFSAASETLANNLDSIGLASWWELCICLVDCCFWLGSASVSERCKSFLPCSPILFSQLQKVTFYLYFTKSISFYLLYMSQDLEKVGCFFWQFGHLVSFGQSSSVNFPHVWRPLQPSLWWPYIWRLKPLKDVLFDPPI